MSSDGHSRTTTSAIVSEGLGKRYQVRGTEAVGWRYRSIREDLTERLRTFGRPAGSSPRDFWAIRDVSFTIDQGERVGVIGRNGAGKSTLLKVLSRITHPTEGRAVVSGRVGSLLEVGAGFHPELTGRDNIFLSGSVYGMRRSEIATKIDEIVEFSGIERFLNTPVKRYSSGMYLRLAFAVAAHLQTDILLVDEVLAVGDAEFQKKCLGQMAKEDQGRTTLFVSHSMPAILRLCNRVILLDGGRVIADGPPPEVIRTYLDSGFGQTAQREWQDPAAAPGDHVARLKSVRVIGPGGAVSEEIDVSQPFDVEVEYDCLTEAADQRPCAGLIFNNADGVCLFTTVDFVNRTWWNAPRHRGTVRATCRLPANLLAEGQIFVSAAICSYSPRAIHALEADAVAFQAVDRSSGEGVRGDFGNEWPGVVRPMLDWDVSVVRADSLPVPGGSAD